MELFTMQEIRAILALLNRMLMTPAEQLYVQGFFERLVAFCTPPPEPSPADNAQAMADAMAMADTLDALDEEE